MSVLTDSSFITIRVCLIKPISGDALNMSTLSTNDQGKSFWELVYSSVNQVLADHQLWRSPFPVTLHRIFNSGLKIVACCFLL